MKIKSLIVDSLSTVKKFPFLILIIIGYYLLNWGIDTVVSKAGSLIYTFLVSVLQLCLLTFLFAGIYNTIGEGSIHGFIPGFLRGFKLVVLFLVDILLLFFIVLGLTLVLIIPLVIIFMVIPRLEPGSLRVFLWAVTWFIAYIPPWLQITIGVPILFLTGARLIYEKVKITDAARWGIRFLRSSPWSTFALGITIELVSLPIYLIAVFGLPQGLSHGTALHAIAVAGVLYGAFSTVFSITMVTEFYQRIRGVKDFNDKEFGRRFVLLAALIPLMVIGLIAIKVAPTIGT